MKINNGRMNLYNIKSYVLFHKRFTEDIDTLDDYYYNYYYYYFKPWHDIKIAFFTNGRIVKNRTR